MAVCVFGVVRVMCMCAGKGGVVGERGPRERSGGEDRPGQEMMGWEVQRSGIRAGWGSAMLLRTVTPPGVGGCGRSEVYRHEDPASGPALLVPFGVGIFG